MQCTAENKAARQAPIGGTPHIESGEAVAAGRAAGRRYPNPVEAGPLAWRCFGVERSWTRLFGKVARRVAKPVRSTKR